MSIISKALEDYSKKLLTPSTYRSENFFKKSVQVLRLSLDSYSSRKNRPLHQHNKHFLDLDQICLFKDLLDKLFSSLKLDGFAENLLKILDLFGSFQGYEEIDLYIGALSQQVEYLKFLLDVCENQKTNYMKEFCALFESCKKQIDKASVDGVKNLKLDESNPDITYYETAIRYLEKYTDKDCLKTQAMAYKNIGRIYRSRQNYKDACNNYLLSIGKDSENWPLLEQIGDILIEQGGSDGVAL